MDVSLRRTRLFIGLSSVVLLTGFSLSAAELASNAKYPPEPSCTQPQSTVMDEAQLKALAASASCPIFIHQWNGDEVLPVAAETYGKISPFWAQEAVGADLAKQFIEKYQGAHWFGGKLDTVPVGIYDGGIDLHLLPSDRLGSAMLACKRDPSSCPRINRDSHGVSVGNLIVGDPPVGVSSQAQLTQVISFEADPNGSDAERKLAQADPAPRFWNLSMGESDDEPLNRIEEKRNWLNQRPRQSTLVVAAGNSYPNPLQWMSKLPRTIVVGAVEPDGLLSEYSQAGEQVVISAPSSMEIRSVGPRIVGQKVFGQLVKFSGTSAATPVVTAALADAQSFLPEMNYDGQVQLLTSTALRTSGYKPGDGKSGAGALNAYLMVRVAAYVRDEKAKGHEISLTDPEMRNHFAEEARNDLDAATHLLGYAPADASNSAAQDARVEKLDCNTQKQAVDLLRKAYFLNPNDPSAGILLATLFRANGYEAQADYVEAPSPEEALRRLATYAKPEPEAQGFLMAEGFRAGKFDPKRVQGFADALRQNQANHPTPYDLNYPADSLYKGLIINGVQPMEPALRAFAETFPYKDTEDDDRMPNLVEGIMGRLIRNKYPDRAVQYGVALLSMNEAASGVAIRTAYGSFEKDPEHWEMFMKELAGPQRHEARKTLLDFASMFYNVQSPLCPRVAQWIQETDKDPETIAQAKALAPKCGSKSN